VRTASRFLSGLLLLGKKAPESGLAAIRFGHRFIRIANSPEFTWLVVAFSALGMNGSTGAGHASDSPEPVTIGGSFFLLIAGLR
jgi:hypothetical protein